MMELKRPNPCPEDKYVNDNLYDILKTRIDEPEHVMSSLSLYMRRIHIGKLLALYEAYRRVVDLPGSVVELGVFKGESLLWFARLMEMLNNNDRSASVIGFDNFRGFENLHEKDGDTDERVDKMVGGWSSAEYYDDLIRLINVFDHDRMAGQKARIKLVEGDICETVPAFVEDHPGLRIRLLNLDCDMYEPTLVGLKHLYPKVVPGGVVLLDEYAFHEFPGESAAVDEFFGDQMPTIRKFPFYSNPGGFIIKPSADLPAADLTSFGGG